MQITIQMLDGSIIPFRVRSSITIASLKAKFQPWQPMKGRALLHHDVQLDDRATLSSVAGVKDGTILRVDNQVSGVKSQITGKNLVMSGPARLALDEDVVESIERSGDDEETSSDNERWMYSSKRKWPSRTSAAAVKEFIDDESIANSPPGMALATGQMGDDSRHMADAGRSNGTMALHVVKKEGRETSARVQADKQISEAHQSGHRLHSFQNKTCLPPENPVEGPTANAHIPRITEPFSGLQQVMEDDDETFLAGLDAAINAAVARTERLPLNSEAGLEEHISARRCHACGRACGCGGDRLAPLSTMMPVEQRIGGEEAAYANSNSNGHLIAGRDSTAQHLQTGWTGMW